MPRIESSITRRRHQPPPIIPASPTRPLPTTTHKPHYTTTTLYTNRQRQRAHKGPGGTGAAVSLRISWSWPYSIPPPILHHPSHPAHHSTAAPTMSVSSSAARHLVRRTLQTYTAGTPSAPARPLLRRRPRPFSTSTAASTPPPPAPPGGATADAPVEAAKEGSWAWRVRTIC